MPHRLTLLLLCLATGLLRAQQADTTDLTRLLQDYKIRTTIGLQLWSTYSSGMSVYDDETEAYSGVDDRINTQLKRSRFIVAGQPYQTLDFQLIAALDFLGRDVLSATDAGVNNSASPIFRIWNLYLKWQLKPDSEGAYLAAGYLVSPLGRESNTPALRSNSYEKAWSQNYLRRHLVGTGPGRAAGLLFGGLRHAENGRLHLDYRIALQNPFFGILGGNSLGRRASPLVTGRLSLMLGDAESERFAMVNKVNYFGARNGVTLSVGAGRQGRTDLFQENSAVGLEVLANYGSFQLDADVYWLQRTAAGGTVQSRTGYVRAGNNISLPRRMILEPVVSYWFFRGPTAAAQTRFATAIRTFAGKDNGLDLGVNLYFNPNLKLSAFYALRRGDAGAGDPVTLINNYFQQPGLGPIERGDYGGLGLVALF